MTGAPRPKNERVGWTDLELAALKPGSKVITVSDRDGLQMRIAPSGAKSWRVAYRHLGKQCSTIVGKYPEVKLREARAACEAIRAGLKAGVAPGRADEAGEVAAEAVAGASEAEKRFDAVAEAYFAKLRAEGRSEDTIDKNRWLFELLPLDLRARPVDQIKPRELLEPLKAIEARGRGQSAGRLRGLMGALFRFAAAMDLCSADPSSLIKGALVTHKTKHRAAVLDRDKFGELVTAVWSYSGQPEVCCCLKLQALTAQRPGEVRHMRWDELDLDEKVWSIPAAKMKMRRDHRVPLAGAVVEILKAHKAIARKSDYCFAGLRSADRVISENTTNAALRRLGFSGDEATSHGWRSSFASFANESGLFSVDAIEKQLAHIDTNEVRAAYVRSDFFEERRRLAEWWADYVLSLVRV